MHEGAIIDASNVGLDDNYDVLDPATHYPIRSTIGACRLFCYNVSLDLIGCTKQLQRPSGHQPLIETITTAQELAEERADAQEILSRY